MKKIILSKGRSEVITTDKLISDYIVLVPDSEKEDYIRNKVKNIETIPDSVKGLGSIRNWVMDNYDGDLVMLDDDITNFYYMGGKSAKRINSTEARDQILYNTYICSKDAGAPCWSINQSTDARKYTAYSPFSLRGWIGSVVGINDRSVRWDCKNKLRVDVDYSLQVLKEKRFMWIEKRFSFYSNKDKNIGGNAFLRSQDNYKSEKRYLKRKWGKYIEFGQGAEKDTVKIKVEREDKSLKIN